MTRNNLIVSSILHHSKDVSSKSGFTDDNFKETLNRQWMEFEYLFNVYIVFLQSKADKHKFEVKMLGKIYAFLFL